VFLLFWVFKRTAALDWLLPQIRLLIGHKGECQILHPKFLEDYNVDEVIRSHWPRGDVTGVLVSSSFHESWHAPKWHQTCFRQARTRCTPHKDKTSTNPTAVMLSERSVAHFLALCTLVHEPSTPEHALWPANR